MEEKSVLARTRKIGGSLVVTIPAQILKLKQLQENQLVDIKINKRKLDYFGALKGIGSYNREEDRMKDRV